MVSKGPLLLVGNNIVNMDELCDESCMLVEAVHQADFQPPSVTIVGKDNQHCVALQRDFINVMHQMKYAYTMECRFNFTVEGVKYEIVPENRFVEGGDSTVFYAEGTRGYFLDSKLADTWVPVIHKMTSDLSGFVKAENYITPHNYQSKMNEGFVKAYGSLTRWQRFKEFLCRVSSVLKP